MGFTEIRIGSVYDYAPLIGKEIGNIVANLREQHRTKTYRGFNTLLKHAVETGDEAVVNDFEHAKKLFPNINRRTWELFRGYVTKGPEGTPDTAETGPDGAPLPKNPEDLMAERAAGVGGGSGALIPPDTASDTGTASKNKTPAGAAPNISPLEEITTPASATSSASAPAKKTVSGSMKRGGVDDSTATFMDEVVGDLRSQTKTIANQEIERESPVLKSKALSELSVTVDRLNTLYNTQPSLSDIQVPTSFRNPRVAELYRERSMQLRAGEIDRLKAKNEVQQLRMANTLASNTVVQEALKNDAAFASSFNAAVSTRNTAALNGMIQQLQAGLGAVEVTMRAADLAVRKEIQANSEAFQLAALKLQTRAAEIAQESELLKGKYEMDSKNFEKSLALRASFTKSLMEMAKEGVFAEPEKHTWAIAAMRSEFAELLNDQMNRNPFAMLTWIQDTVGANDDVSKFIRMVAKETHPTLIAQLEDAKNDPVLQRAILGKYAEQFAGKDTGVLPSWGFAAMVQDEEKERLRKEQENLLSRKDPTSPQASRGFSSALGR